MAREFIPIAKPLLGREEHAALLAPIESGWVTQGPEVAAFEAEFAAFTGALHACAVSSCTAALHLALLALGVQPGDEVVTVSHSFIATANAICYTGAMPVFVDIDPATYNLDPALLDAAITSKTRAILCVHQMGMPCDLAAILAIAKAHGLPVIEDAACAAGSELLWGGQWAPIGAPHGDICCFSFHPRKVITTGDGGMLTTRNPLWDAKFRLLRQHGMSVPDTVRHGSAQVVVEHYTALGYNYRMTDLQAAVGRVQLGRLPGIVAERRRLAERYRAALAPMDGVTPPQEPEWARSNWQSYAVRLEAGIDQRGLMQGMLDAGIATKPGIMNAHREPCLAAHTPRFPLPHSEAAQDHVVLLPLFPGLSDAQQDYVVEMLDGAIKRGQPQ